MGSLVRAILASCALSLCTLLAPAHSQAQPCTPDLTREEAIAAVLAPTPPDSLVIMSYPTPVCPGQSLVPFIEANPPSPPISIVAPSWFFFEDDDPRAEYAHEVTFILVSRDGLGGIVIERHAEEWWPVLNGTELYSEPLLNQASPDRIWGSYPGTFCPASLAAPSGPPDGKTAPPRVEDAEAAAPKLCAYLFKGKHYNPHRDNNVNLMKNALKDNTRGPGVPEANITVADLRKKQSITDAVNALNAANCTQAYIYICCHANFEEIAGTEERISADDLRAELARLKACSVFFFLQSCQSYAHTSEVKDGLRDRDGAGLFVHDPKTIATFASANFNRKSAVNDDDVDNDKNVSYWTRDIAAAFTKEAADGNGDGKVSPVEAFDYVAANGCAETRKPQPQKEVSESPCSTTATESVSWGQVKSLYR